MDIDEKIRYTRAKGQPHLHLYLSEEEYINLGKPRKIINNLVNFLELKIADENINYLVRKAFEHGIYYIKLELD